MAEPPDRSRITRGPTRTYRSLARDRIPRAKRQLRVGDLLRAIIARHGLSDEVRQRAVCLYWDEIAGARLAPKTWPVSFADGVLHVETETSTWVHELQFHKAPLVARINDWVERNRNWIGPPPLVVDIRVGLGMRRRTPVLVDRDYVRQLVARHRRRIARAAECEPTKATDAERETIIAETAAIADPELRALVEKVRVRWNV